tara:strand:- start:147 stop:848 length:702 start_codon:yes stop_codon:yes gene_type:complete
MKKLTKHQRQYRKRKKEGNKPTKWITREDGKRVEVIANKQLCVRVNDYAAQRLHNVAQEQGKTKGELLTHMLIWGGGQVLDIVTPNWFNRDEPIKNKGEDGIKYKGSTGTRQLNLPISSTAWNKLESYKLQLGLSKARIVQSIILYYTFLSPEQLAKRNEAEKRRQQEAEQWRNKLFIPQTQEQQEETQKKLEEYYKERERKQDEFFDSVKKNAIENYRDDGRLSETQSKDSE